MQRGGTLLMTFLVLLLSSARCRRKSHAVLPCCVQISRILLEQKAVRAMPNSTIYSVGSPFFRMPFVSDPKTPDHSVAAVTKQFVPDDKQSVVHYYFNTDISCLCRGLKEGLVMLHFVKLVPGT